jgi:hypothetical protein
MSVSWGDGDFLMNILSEADERMDRRYELKSLGDDLDKVEKRGLEIYQIEKEELYSKGSRKNNFTFLHLIFRLSSSNPQPQNPRNSPAIPVVLRFRIEQI